MTSPTMQFAPSNRMAMYESMHQISMWDDTFDGAIGPGTAMCLMTEMEGAKMDDKIEYTSDKSVEHAEDGQASRSISEKIQRRLAQNREAARKSRQRKKAYVQQLETSRLKLAQLEQELERARQQSQGFVITPSVGLCSTVNAGLAAFEMEYGHWIEEQERKIAELRNILQTPIGDADLRMIVENVLNHYCNLFRMKRDAARLDAFYLVSGMWKTSLERFFLWIGGFRPSELINVVTPQLEELTDNQNGKIGNLRHSCLQAEDALSAGMEKLHQTLTQSIGFVAVAGGGNGNYHSQAAAAMDKLEGLEGFIHQADHLREQTLQQMSRILTTRQAAKGLLAFGEYFQRLRALSAVWIGRRPPEPAD